MNQVLPQSLAERLREARRHRSITQAQIAAELNIHQSQVSRILRGEFRFARGHVLKLCKFLEVNLHETEHSSSRLSRAINQIWDGTAANEAAILKMINAIGRWADRKALSNKS